MKHKITTFIATAAILVVALFAAGCGALRLAERIPRGRTAPPPPQSSKAATEAAEVAVADSALGRILVDGAGRTLYLFEKDTSTASTCDGDCASLWRRSQRRARRWQGKRLGRRDWHDQRTDGETEVTRRSSALLLRRRHQGRRYDWTGPRPVRRRVERALTGGQEDRVRCLTEPPALHGPSSPTAARRPRRALVTALTSHQGVRSTPSTLRLRRQMGLSTDSRLTLGRKSTMRKTTLLIAAGLVSLVAPLALAADCGVRGLSGLRTFLR